MKNAEKVFNIIEDYGDSFYSNEKILRKIYFGIQLCSQKKIKAKYQEKMREKDQADLKRASAESALSNLICNQGKI